MTRRTRDLLTLYALALLVNGAVALLTTQPGPVVDASYYFAGGLRLAGGHGFTEPYFWNWLNPPAALPAPAFGYWQPLPSLVAAAGIALFGGQMPAFGAAQVPFVLMGSVVPLLAYLAAEPLGERRHAWLTGLLAVFSGIYVINWSLPESFTPFALSAGGALLLAGRAEGRRWRWLAAGVLAGLAHLARADGVLVVLVVAFVALLPRGAVRPFRARLLDAALVVGGYLLAMAPWMLRNIAAFGAVQSPGGLSTLWLVQYEDLFAYPVELSPARYFAAGTDVVLGGKWRALVANLLTFVVVHNLVFLTPFTVVGWARRWRRGALLPAGLYGLALFGAMTVAFTLPGVRGGWLHSGAALVPFVMAAAALGLDDAIRWAARRRRGWDARQAWRVFGASAVGLAAFVTVFVVLTRVVGSDDLSTVAWNQSNRVFEEVGAALDAAGAPADALVMTNNPPGFWLMTGHGGVPLVYGELDALLSAADSYGVRYLLLDANAPPWLFEQAAVSPSVVEIESFGGMMLYELSRR